MDINKELIPTKLNSSYSIRETVITTSSSVDDMTTSIQPHLSHPSVDIDEKPIPPELNSPSGVRATATPSGVNALSQPFPSSANANKDLTYPSDIDTKTETLRCLTPVAPVGDYILQPTVFSSAVIAPVGDGILQPTAFSSARAFEHLNVYVSS